LRSEESPQSDSSNESPEEVDSIAAKVESHGGKIIDPLREYPFWPGYYSVFFTDPDGIKLEVILNPQHRDG
jgi:predicted lactoylglutathione lyase